MRRNHNLHSLTYILLPLWLMTFSGLVLAASPQEDVPPAKASSPKDATLDSYLRDCDGKASKAANCEKLRKDTIDILKEDMYTLGSTASRTYLPEIIGMFSSDEPDLRIAAADALGMIGPQDSDVEELVPLTNDPVPDVRQAVSQMIGRGKGTAVALLKQRSMPMRTGHTPDKPADPAKFGLPVAPDSTYLFDSSDTSVGRLSYVTKGKSDPASFFKAKAKKGPFKLEEFQQKYRFQIQDEQEALTEAQQAAGKEIENTQPPDPSNLQAFTEFMQKIASVGAKQGSRMYLDSYEPNLFGSPTVYVLEERQIGKRSYPTRYAVVYQEQAFKRPGYRLSWMTVPDDTIKTAQAASLAEEKEEIARNKENAALKKRGEALEDLVKKKDEQEKKDFKKGQADLEKELGF
ncbi:MAG TPA: HEAT repeat domain-containing protein [Nitrospiraceae bacterium]|nr:HEAT repeat domain-containing protein [Nitrospiraceae bacterium]